MKKLLKDICISWVFSLACMPAALIGLGLAGYLWEKIEKRLNK